MQDECKKITDARDYQNMVPFSQHPQPGEYVVTGLQVGNVHGEKGWHYYVGYVVQIRKKAGAFGSDAVFLRHPNGELFVHSNQSYYRMNDYWLSKLKALYPEGMTPEDHEDYSKAYTICDKYPELGKIVEATPDTTQQVENGPPVTITIDHGDGTKTVETII